MNEPKAFFLVGPTASGKTAVAQWIAEREGYDILSADSMLVYAGMDVGTAKPDVAARAGVRYWCVDLVGPAATFSVAAYRLEALRALVEIERAGRRAIVVGGTGLYVKCLTDGLRSGPGPDSSARAEWERVLAERGTEALEETLRQREPAAWAALADRKNPRRLIRALERCGRGDDPAAGQAPRRTWLPAGISPPMAGLRMPMPVLHGRIAERVARMYRGGLLAETKALLAAGFPASGTARQAIGYAEAAAVLAGTCPIEKAMERTVVRTRQLAKRQMTWFRRQANVKWVDVDPNADTGAVAAQVLDIWRHHGPTPIAA